jgi:hypothetical protein
VPINVIATLRKAARELEAERARIDQQLAAIGSVLGSVNSTRGRAVRAARPVSTRRRRRWSAPSRRALSQRMKAWWAKRKAAAAKGKSIPRKG